MNLEKIDKRLLKEISILKLDKKSPCFIFGKNLNFTKEILTKNNIHILHEYPFINSLYCVASQKQIYNISSSSQVDFISSLANVTSLMFVSKNILQTAQFKSYGQNIGIAFIDTGISPHCDFMIGKNRISFFKDFINNKTNCYDDNGHGTFVCGVCSGNGCLSRFKYSGIAPKSSIFALKALDMHGEANASKILDAMEWVFDNHRSHGIHIVCMSFGSEPLGANDPIMLGAEALWNEGIVVVAAAGNSGPEYQTIKSPGISPKIITVGGIDDNRYNSNTFNKNFFEIANFSSRGPAFRNAKPDLVAPSVDIISCGTKSDYCTLSGTSVATPMIAGISALLIEKDPSATPIKIKNQLIRLCQPLGFERNLEGYGLPCFKNLK